MHANFESGAVGLTVGTRTVGRRRRRQHARALRRSTSTNDLLPIEQRPAAAWYG